MVATTALLMRHRSEEHTSELQSRLHLVCRLLLEKKYIHITMNRSTQHALCGAVCVAASARGHFSSVSCQLLLLCYRAISFFFFFFFFLKARAPPKLPPLPPPPPFPT